MYSPCMSPSQMALRGVERERSEGDGGYGGHHGYGVAMTAQGQLSPVSLKEYQERAL